MESYGIQVILAIRFHQIQWNLVGSRWFSNQIPSNPVEKSLGPWDFSNQILSNPMELYDDLIDVIHIQNFMVQRCLLLRGALQGPIWPCGGGY